MSSKPCCTKIAALLPATVSLDWATARDFRRCSVRIYPWDVFTLCVSTALAVRALG
ncbi:hypothetical protein PR002_g6918 [Phytophthora rubi]|uniref:Uncharacterized protein n=1 Tax=Phytophthora rubi TaxID=129364 RepID=A0A6A3N539_9STRA|nr:hypothetical protein PR002_g6918 [Phytophthora rubi]